MAQIKSTFKHESLQSRKSIQDILKALTKGIGKGVVELTDDEGDIILEPEGLLNLKISARKEDSHNRLDIRIRWQTEEEEPKQKSLSVGSPRRKS